METPASRGAGEAGGLAERVAGCKPTTRTVWTAFTLYYIRRLGCFCGKLRGFHVSEIVLRQASVSVKINRPNTARPPVPIADSFRPRDLGAVHECDLVVGKRKSRVNVR
jgi:hypothetical protein